MIATMAESDRIWLEQVAAWVDQSVAPAADTWDRDERIPADVLRQPADRGDLGCWLPNRARPACGMDVFGMYCETIGRGSLSLLSGLVVHAMVLRAIQRWGDDAQRDRWLEPLADGRLWGAFALSEPEIGSDAAAVQTTARPTDQGFVLSGVKQWISFAQHARLFLVVALCDGQPAAFLVERDTPGLDVRPMHGLLGFRAAMLGEIHLQDCCVPRANLVGRVGFGLSHVVGTALDLGRYMVAWGSVGLAQACVDAAMDYSATRRQFGRALREHQLIQGLLADMLTQTTAARALCREAAGLRDAGDPQAIPTTSMAKYYASRVAFDAARDALQIHGANGCGQAYPVQRYFRDAKILEIIEGSNQIQQIIIARSGQTGRARARRGRSA